MFFNSSVFFFFFVIVYVFYWLLQNNLRVQNTFLLIVSYLFYGWWDWRFTFLLALSTFIDYFFGFLIATHKHKRLFLWLSIFNNLLVLGVFKYYNFFASSFQTFALKFNVHLHPYILDIALPVGISFYTFHGMSYVFDIFKKKIEPSRNYIDYSLFVCFFPLLVAGPIERASHLLPQVEKKRNFDYSQSVEGLRLILWGFFKKIVIADSLSRLVDIIFGNYHHMSSLSLVVGSIYFAFQIYADFSGYSDIARGIAKLLGFELLINFKFPYFSRDIAEFWRRWHISLSSWFRDYLYIPLGGSREGLSKALRNTFVIFLVSGFWHGANWTYIFWGLLHAIYFLPLLVRSKNRKHLGPTATGGILSQIKEILSMVITFGLVCLAWIFFRAPTIHDAFTYIYSALINKFIIKKELGIIFKPYLVLCISLLIGIEWMARNNNIEHVFNKFKIGFIRHSLYFFILFLIVMFGSFKESGFIYFQF